MRRLLLTLALACLVLMAGLAPVTAQPASKPPPKPPQKGTEKPPQLPTTSSVFYRDKGAKDWNLFGVYKSEESGKAVFRHLASNGYEVELRISNVAVPKTPPRPPSGLLPAAETVTFAKCKEVFETMSRQADIAFKFPTDGCYARAHIMCQRMQKMGLKPRKIWSFANGEPLYARTDHHPAKYVTWGYHVAPALRVRIDNNTQRWYVIDPSLFNAPSTVQQWEEAQMKTKESHKPYLTITRIGQPPKLLSGKSAPGTGYWPGSDPKEGIDAHAVATMKKYKPYEDKAPPKGVVRSEGFPAFWAPSRRSSVLA